MRDTPTLNRCPGSGDAGAMDVHRGGTPLDKGAPPADPPNVRPTGEIREDQSISMFGYLRRTAAFTLR